MAIDHEPTAAPGPGQHDIGPRGTIVVAVEADDVRIRGVAGTTARVVAPAGGAGLETTAEPGRFVVRSGRAARFATFGLRIGGHGIGMTIAGTIELEVPQDARVEVHATAGDVAIRDVRGGVSVKTASGDVSIKRTAGEVTASLASGDLHVEAVAPVRVEARSVAGDVRIRAPRFDLVAIETVSGDVELVGAFGPGVDHAISTISGDVELGLAGGLTLSSKSVSGDVDCRHPDRRSGDGRRQPLVVGDGAARLAVRSMSGDVKVRTAPAPGPSVAPTPPDPADPAGRADAADPACADGRADGRVDPAGRADAVHRPGRAKRNGPAPGGADATGTRPVGTRPIGCRRRPDARRPRSARPRRDRRPRGRAPAGRDARPGRHAPAADRPCGQPGPLRWLIHSTTSFASSPRAG